MAQLSVIISIPFGRPFARKNYAPHSIASFYVNLVEIKEDFIDLLQRFRSRFLAPIPPTKPSA